MKIGNILEQLLVAQRYGEIQKLIKYYLENINLYPVNSLLIHEQ